MKKQTLVVTDDIPRYAKKGDKAILIGEYKEKQTGGRMREVEFENGDYLVFGDKAFDLMLKFKK